MCGGNVWAARRNAMSKVGMPTVEVSNFLRTREKCFIVFEMCSFNTIMRSYWYSYEVSSVGKSDGFRTKSQIGGSSPSLRTTWMDTIPMHRFRIEPKNNSYAIVAQLVERRASTAKVARSCLVYRSGSCNDRCARQSGKTLDCSDRRTIWRVPIVGKAERLMNLG